MGLSILGCLDLERPVPYAKHLVHRDAMSDLALHFLNKMKIMVVKEVEREEIEFICKVRLSASSLGVKKKGWPICRLDVPFHC